MVKKSHKFIICLGMAFLLNMSASAEIIESVPISNNDKSSSLLGSPKAWVMGPATGFPSMLGWRVERFWQEDMRELPLWLAGADFAIFIPSARLTVERRLLEGPFYAGLGGRILNFLYYGYKEETNIYSLSIPISYRSGIGWEKWSAHVSLSAEVFTNDFREWQVLPALQISFLNKM